MRVPEKTPVNKVAKKTHKQLQGKLSGEKTTGVCKECKREFNYIKVTVPRKYCDDCQPASHKAKLKTKPSFGAKGASTGVDPKAAANLNQHHLGNKLAVTVGD